MRSKLLRLPERTNFLTRRHRNMERISLCSPPLTDCASSLKEGKISVAARQLILGWFDHSQECIMKINGLRKSCLNINPFHA